MEYVAYGIVGIVAIINIIAIIREGKHNKEIISKKGIPSSSTLNKNK